MAAFLLLAAAGPALAQASRPARPKAFAEIEKLVVKPAGWARHRRQIALRLADERKRLGKDFDAELARFVGRDVLRHRWMARLLSEEPRPGGAEARPLLALAVCQQAVAILQGRKQLSDEDRAGLLALRAKAAVLAARGGWRALAAWHKTRAKRLLREGRKRPWGKLPPMSEAERTAYQRIVLLIDHAEDPGDEGKRPFPKSKKHPLLARLLTMQEMLALLRSRPDQDEDTKVYTIGPSVMAAVAAKKLGLDPLAASHKARVERMLKAEPILVGGWPAMYEADQKVYRSIHLPAPKDSPR